MDIEHSEMLFYQNMILREQGKDKESMEHLEKYEKFMTDKLKVQEIKGMKGVNQCCIHAFMSIFKFRLLQKNKHVVSTNGKEEEYIFLKISVTPLAYFKPKNEILICLHPT